MADRIVVSTDMLEKWAGDLSQVQSAIADAAKTLSSVPTTKDAGGELKISMDASLKNGAKISGGDVKAVLKSLSGAMGKTSQDVAVVSDSLKTAAGIFADAEEANTKAIDNVGSKQDESNSQGETGVMMHSMDEQARMDDLVKMMEEFLRSTNIMVSNYYDQFGLGIVALVGAGYSIINESADKVLLNNYNSSKELLDSILKQHAQGDRSLDIMDSAAEFAKDRVDGYKDRYETKGLLKGGLDDASKEYLKELDKLADTVEGMQWAAEVLNRYDRMMKMDPAEAKQIAAGLRANGDRTSIMTAEALECVGDPNACLKYALKTTAVDLGTNELSDAAEELTKAVVETDPTFKALYTTAKATTAVTDMSMGTQKTAEAAMHAQNMSKIQKANYDVAQKALADYKANPTKENYGKLKESFNAYNMTSAETLDAYKSALDARDKSALGMIVIHGKTKGYKSDLTSAAQGIRNHNTIVNKMGSAYSL